MIPKIFAVELNLNKRLSEVFIIPVEISKGWICSFDVVDFEYIDTS